MFEGLARDLEHLKRGAKTLKKIKIADPKSSYTAADDFETHVDAYSARQAVVMDDQSFTYAELDALANRFAHWARAQGLGKGDSVALLMHNRPEYLAAWIGLVKLGIRVALINTNLKAHPLAHCVGLAEARHLILDAELQDNHHSAKEFYDGPVTVWAWGGDVEGSEDLNVALDKASPERPDPSLREGLVQNDVALLIYTSGTTGLPKAALIKHYRLFLMFYGYAGMVGTTGEDRMYIPLPLYHSTGGQLGVGVVFTQGGTAILTKRFSASKFWDDVVDHRATMFSYVGELCRYLVNAPEHPKERQHQIRRIFGNGLRPDVWPDFVRRFGIHDIVEFYAATEGNIALFNVAAKEGSVGRVPWFLKQRFPYKIVRFDTETEEPVRDSQGRLIEADFMETGELIGKIDPNKAQARFEGYSDDRATEKKVLRDAFKEGDAWFRSGDLLKKDKEGFYYFVDRIGDTFRWKGENVSTLEVAHVITGVETVAQATVYGVEVPGYDGRAGMAAVVFANGGNVQAIYDAVSRELPSYAMPRFLRLREQLESTGTFKERKVDLVREGFDPDQVSDPIYVLDMDAGTYRKLDSETYQSVLDGTYKL